MSTEDIAISVNGVSKYFKPTHSHGSIKQLATSVFKKNKGSAMQSTGYWALKDVSFDIKKGEFFGIVGKNGSGKSTLLKMMAGVYNPTKGSVTVSGRLIPFIELGVGFNPELSGRDNVFLNGALLGFNRKEMTSMYEEIVQFAELQDHMDVKLKNFSSGMQVRLAFSIAVRAKADILLIDEVLAVGDLAFQQKCLDYFDLIKSSGKTVVFVSHDMQTVRRYCDRAVFIENSKIVKIGDTNDVVNDFAISMSDAIDGTEAPEKKVAKVEKITFKKASLLQPASATALKRSDTISIAITYSLHSKIDHYVGLAFILGNTSVAEANNSLNARPGAEVGEKTVTFNVDLATFLSGVYRVNVAFFKKSNSQMIGYKNKVFTFSVDENHPNKGGTYYLNIDWQYN